MLVILHFAVSPRVSEKIIIRYSNIATTIVESLPGVLGKRGEKNGYFMSPIVH